MKSTGDGLMWFRDPKAFAGGDVESHGSIDGVESDMSNTWT